MDYLKSLKEINYLTAPGLTPMNWENYTLRVFDLVCGSYDITRTQLQSGNRSRKFTEARQVLCYILRRHNKKITLKQLSRLINRHHASVIHSIRQAEALMSYDKEYRVKIKKIETKAQKIKFNIIDPVGVTVESLRGLPTNERQELIKIL